MGFSVKLDTNGSNPRMLAELIEEGLVDYVALDVKAPLLEEKYQAVIGIQANGILGEVEKSIELLRNSGTIDYEFRTTVVPGLLGREDVELIAERISGAKRFYLQQFRANGSHVDGSYSQVTPYPLELLQDVRNRIAKNFQICRIRGLGSP
jgi:pyruvate formate lyase activating enzyme